MQLFSYFLLACPVLLHAAEMMENGENFPPEILDGPREERENSSNEVSEITSGVKSQCKCGWINKWPSKRITGGDFYTPHKYPFVANVAMVSGAKVVLFCGGSIITTTHVLSAAHCLVKVQNVAQLGVLAGVYDINNLESADLRLVKKMVPHENYNTKTHANDIAILVLSAPLTYSVNIGPVCLPAQTLDVAAGETVKVLGWGSQREQGPTTSKPKEMDAKVVTIASCSTAWQGTVVIPTTRPTQICASNQTSSPCQGDSGGPLVWLDPSTNQYTLVGVISFGNHCLGDRPSVNTKVQSYLPWISQLLSGNSNCAI